MTFLTRDTKSKRTVETRYAMRDFVKTLGEHIPDRYRHSVRHFGLLAPRLKARTHELVFVLMRQERLGKPKRLSWALMRQKTFGVDPLIDAHGHRMRWIQRIPPHQRPKHPHSP